MRLLLIFILFPTASLAESLIALRTIQARDIITAEDLSPVDAVIDGALTEASHAVGREARVTIYAGRPIRAADIGAPALVERNQIVPLVYAAGGLQITAEGRALDRGGEGDVIRVMNLSSRVQVTGIVDETGAVRVGMTTEGTEE
jgi:flagellar basal body P-ring formation protein FlgA